MRTHTNGFLVIHVLVVATIALLFLGGLASWTALSILSARQASNRERAIQIAEAGVDYYRWHLAHAPQDFQDGTGAPGPYVHPFTDKNGVQIGTFSLDIAPPPLGSSLVTVTSTGAAEGNLGAPRTIRVQLAKPSFAQFAVVANDVMRFGAGTEVFGPIHSNNGIRFDGLAHNIVSSALGDYNDPDHTGANEFGVHTHVAPVDPLPPAAIPSRPDVFETGRQVSVPAVDFVGITADVAQMKTDAQTNGFYRPSAGALGYHVVLQTDDTFRLSRVTSLVNPPSGCTNVSSQSGWGSWSINNEQLIDTYPLPANGILFLEDDIFVDGQISSARVTIVAAFLPDNPPLRKSIIVNNDLRYTTYDGQDVIGLIAQGNITVGMVSDTDLQVDAALIAQTGRVGRYYYRPPNPPQNRCSPYHARQVITLIGMIGTYQRYGFAYTDGTGYQIRNLNYDANLLYTPPPSFPLTSDQYEILSWEEVK